MFLCSKTEKITFSLIVVFLCCFLSFHISEYSNTIESAILGDNIPEFYIFFMDVSSIIVSVTPLLFFLFLFGTTSIMTNFFFDLNCKREEIMFSAGLSLIPLFFSLFFSWYNLVNYVNYDVISNGESIKDIIYAFGMSYSDIENINLISRILIYITFIFSTIIQVREHYSKLLISTTVPSIMVILVYNIISVL